MSRSCPARAMTSRRPADECLIGITYEPVVYPSRNLAVAVAD